LATGAERVRSGVCDGGGGRRTDLPVSPEEVDEDDESRERGEQDGTRGERTKEKTE
jgi:hypothetical protein